MLQRATHAFIGVIEDQQFQYSPFLRVPGFPDMDRKEQRYWRVLRRRVHVELLLKGSEPRKEVDVFEIFWTGGASGDWNSTQNNERNLFLVRVENGRYHVVRDWWRSIFPINSGTHGQLPLTDSRPFWERVGLLTWWVKPDRRKPFENIARNDPGQALGLWRTVKLLRGLLRHPDRRLRLCACTKLLFEGLAQDECWDTLNEEDRQQLIADSPGWLTPESIRKNHEGLVRHATELWNTLSDSRDQRRLFTTANDRHIRDKFCREYTRRYPGDLETGCPADKPLPASIVTKDGDVPLLGPWPQ